MSAKPSSILVVDDDVDTCRNLHDILTDLGYQVDVAHEGATALAHAQGKHYDVALLDLRMPGMDGLTLFREIKKLSAGTIGIIVTAYATGSTLEDAGAAGVTQVLAKPVDLPRLLQLIDSTLGQPLVLVVDDDPALCANLWDILQERNYRVFLAHDIDEGAACVQQKDFQVVLIDMRLPHGDGRELFHLVREVSPQARTVIITGYRSELEETVQKVLEEGADAAVYKPFDVPQLLRTLERLAVHKGGKA